MKFLFAIALWLALAMLAFFGYPWRLGQHMPPRKRFVIMFGVVLPGFSMLGVALLSFALVYFMGRPHDWTQTMVCGPFRSGERLISQCHYRSEFVQTALLSNCWFIEWTTGKKELVASEDHLSARPNHYAFSKDGNDYVIGVGRKVYYRPKTTPAGHWNSWTLTGSPEIYNFVKKYLDTHAPGCYSPDTNQFAPAGAIEIKCNRLGREQPLVVSPHGNLGYFYEIGAIRNRGREMIAVPFAPNPFAPKRLVFSHDVDSNGWRFDETLTTAANKP